MFAVTPKLNCPHLEQLQLDEIYEQMDYELISSDCSECYNNKENWLCLLCKVTFCSRYINGHMASHNQKTGHNVAFSFSDASFWCYDCDCYVDSQKLSMIARKMGDLKFPKFLPTDNSSFCLSYSDFVNGFKSRRFQKVTILTGAGISVAAGIPDFRTPGSGLYSKVSELGLPCPEAIFSLDYLKSKPEVFFNIAKGFLSYNAEPVQAHYFIKKISDEGMLQMNFTQNIDGLELNAGLPLEMLVQAHGHMRSAHCCICNSVYPISTFHEYVERGDVMYCTRPGCLMNITNNNAMDGPSATESTKEFGDKSKQEVLETKSGVVKPDIVFFGESLPTRFIENTGCIKEADLVIIMGTSLKVYPFAALLGLVSQHTPIVIINREEPECVSSGSNNSFDNIVENSHCRNLSFSGKDVLFIPGDIEESITRIAGDIGWVLDSSQSTDNCLR